MSVVPARARARNTGAELAEDIIGRRASGGGADSAPGAGAAALLGRW